MEIGFAMVSHMASLSEKSLAMIIRHERRARAWSQEHLAEAAGVNLRTVQRVERGSPCSGETIQSLAGALALDSGALAAAAAVRQDHRWLGLSGTKAVWIGAMLCLPGFVFVAVNVAYHELDVGALGPIMVSQMWETFTAYSLTPVIVLGGPVLAFILNAPHLVRLKARKELDATIVDGIVFHWRTRQWMVVGVAFILITTMVVYGAIENLEHMINGD